jgi:hypothetical protein
MLETHEFSKSYAFNSDFLGAAGGLILHRAAVTIYTTHVNIE